MKAKKICISIIAIVVCCILGWKLYTNVLRIHNVFDDMYYTRVHTYFNWWNPGKFKGKFSNMSQLERVNRDSEQAFTQEGYFAEHYKADYLEDGNRIGILFYAEYQKITIYYLVGETEDTPYEDCLEYQYEYSVKDKTLTYTTNDPDNVERKNFLYDIVLTDWFEANPSVRFSLDDLGEFELIDETDADAQMAQEE